MTCRMTHMLGHVHVMIVGRTYMQDSCLMVQGLDLWHITMKQSHAFYFELRVRGFLYVMSTSDYMTYICLTIIPLPFIWDLGAASHCSSTAGHLHLSRCVTCMLLQLPLVVRKSCPAKCPSPAYRCQHRSQCQALNCSVQQAEVTIAGGSEAEEMELNVCHR